MLTVVVDKKKNTILRQECIERLLLFFRSKKQPDVENKNFGMPCNKHKEIHTQKMPQVKREQQQEKQGTHTQRY